MENMHLIKGRLDETNVKQIFTKKYYKKYIKIKKNLENRKKNA